MATMFIPSNGRTRIEVRRLACVSVSWVARKACVTERAVVKYEAAVLRPFHGEYLEDGFERRDYRPAAFREYFNRLDGLYALLESVAMWTPTACAPAGTEPTRP